MTSQIRVDEITNRSGLGTVTIYDNGFEFTGVTTFTENVDIEGNLTIGGVLTYEDTTNIDSVGVITARAGVHVTGGNLAVGHNNPTAKLDVSGNIYVSSDSFTGENAGIFFSGWNDYGAGVYGRNSGNDLVMNAGASEKVRITSDGKVGIGTDNPLNGLDILQSSGRTRVTSFGHIITQNRNHGTTNYWSIAPRNGGELDIAYGSPDGNGTITGDKLTITSEGEMYLTGGTTNGSLHFWEGAGVSGNSDTARLGVGKNNNTLIYSNAASPSRSNFAIGTSGNIPLILSTSNTTRLRITSGGITEFLGTAIKMPVGTSDPGSAATGWAYYNSSNAQLRIYDGSTWGGVRFSTKGTQTNPAASSSDLSASGSLAQYYFAPDGGTAFQNYACGGLSNLGTIPSGGPSWVSTHNSLIMIVKGQVGQTSQYVMSQGNFLKFFSESISRTTNTPYLYWAVFDGGTLWGITRTRWTGATYSTWSSRHDWDSGDGAAPSGTVNWDVWKTGSGTTGNNLATGTYTVSNDSNLVRAVLPQQDHNNAGTAYGIHYKRLNDGEHYPWFNSSGNLVSNGYFRPSGTYNLGTDTRYVHYIYLADS